MIPRYETPAMRRLWSQEAILERWTEVEVAACKAWGARGEVPAEDLRVIVERARAPEAARVREIEEETHHDMVAFVRALGEIVGEPASRHLHRGLTSSDVLDTALAMALRDSVQALAFAVSSLQQAVAELASRHRLTPMAGRTHGIHAEPSTFGLRLAGWHAELSRHLGRLASTQRQAGVGKLSGAVGTFSQTPPDVERDVLLELGLEPEPVATQVVPRDRHAEVLNTLALLGAGLERFAVEIRSLQRTDLGEVREPFGKGQTGSSAMPHKKNPILCERVTGMARLLRGYAGAGLENVALWHDRDISHSSVERVILPDAFHVAHYMTQKMTQVLQGLQVDAVRMRANLDSTGGLIFSQRVLGIMLAKGFDRHAAYRVVQRAAHRVGEEGVPDFRAALEGEDEVREALSDEDLDSAFDLEPYYEHIDTLFERAGIPPA